MSQRVISNKSFAKRGQIMTRGRQTESDRQTDRLIIRLAIKPRELSKTQLLSSSAAVRVFLKRCLAGSAVLTKPASVNLSATALNKSPVRHFLLSRRLIMSTSFRRREKNSASSSYQKCQLCPFCARFFKEGRLLNPSRVRMPTRAYPSSYWDKVYTCPSLPLNTGVIQSSYQGFSLPE